MTIPHKIRGIIQPSTSSNKKDLVCYCFEYTREDIENDYLANAGESDIIKRIISEKKAGTCACLQKNPQGR